MGLIFNGSPVCLSRGAPGPDGNPIGTVISLMGLEAPTDYLVCDGATYNIADYNDLATYFASQFGSKNHFGGDGTTTFAVPDLRNLFLRGYHGEAEEQLSGDVGMKQEATEHPGVWGGTTTANNAAIIAGIQDTASTQNRVSNADTSIVSSKLSVANGNKESNTRDDNVSFYTSRPVNTAVLFCIKARTSSPAYEQYSTEEQRVGTYIDGKPIYKKTIVDHSLTESEIVDENIGLPLEQTGFITLYDGRHYPFPYYASDGVLKLVSDKSGKLYLSKSGSFADTKSFTATYWYTKTTD